MAAILRTLRTTRPLTVANPRSCISYAIDRDRAFGTSASSTTTSWLKFNFFLVPRGSRTSRAFHNTNHCLNGSGPVLNPHPTKPPQPLPYKITQSIPFPHQRSAEVAPSNLIIVDVRSPSEYQEDHVIGAINIPVLNDQERAQVGTLYKNNRFEAKRLGAALISANISESLRSGPPAQWGQDTNIICYCWRGGDRSRSMSHILGKIGWNVTLLDGGYKRYREDVNSLVNNADTWNNAKLRIISGKTGSGKGLLLNKIRELGGQVLDLEEAASHYGSILGSMHFKNMPQPSQKLFESRIYHQLVSQNFTPEKPLYLEYESARIGNVHIPSHLWRVMTRCPKIVLNVDDIQQRVAYIRRQYRHYETTHIQDLHRILTMLKRFVGGQRVARWEALLQQEKFDEFVVDMLLYHYDPAYDRAARRRAEARCTTTTTTTNTTITTAASSGSRVVDAQPVMLDLHTSIIGDEQYSALARQILEAQ